VRTIVDPAAELVPTVRRVFGRMPRVVDAGRAVLLDGVKLRLDAGERELWIVEVTGTGLERWIDRIEVRGDLERAVQAAKERLRS
jgi:hypothetical protein